MMHPVHIGIPIPKKPWDRHSISNIIVAAILTIVIAGSAWLTLALKERSAGELITAAAMVVWF